MTFQECGDAYIKAHEVGWRHPLSRQNWRGSLSNWVYPIIGKLPVVGKAPFGKSPPPSPPVITRG